MEKRYPFKFLNAYTREDKVFFFGRDDEITELYEMLFQTDLLLVYGASGTGKTSLIQCGLANKFESHDWLALNIRRGADLNDTLARDLDNAAGGEAGDGADLDWLNTDWSSDSTTTETTKKLRPLARRFKAIYLRHFKPIYLIFDQFEELYILGNKAEQEQFVQTVREILQVEQPVKIIISIREEYLGHLYEFEREVPELLRKKLRVEPMNLDKVETVIRSVGAQPASNVRLQAGEEETIAEAIFEKIRGKNTLTIDLPYLQVFLDKLYLQIAGDESRQAEAVFTLAALQKMGDIGDVLRDFLDEQVVKIARELQQQPDAIWEILSPFVTLDATKAPLSEAELCDRRPDTDAALIAGVLQALVKSRILRFTEHDQHYEIAHDSLARQIAAKRSDEEIALLEVQRLIQSQTTLKAEAREFFSEKQLVFIEPYLEKFRPSAEERDWIAQSRAFWQQEKAEKERRQRQELENNRLRRLLRLMRILLSTAILALSAAGYFAYVAAGSAQRVARSARIAAENEQIALEKSEEAETRRIEADSARAYALRQKAIAEDALQRMIAIERVTKGLQAQSYRTQAGDLHSKKQYDNAIAAYRSALTLAEDAKTRRELQSLIAQCQSDKRDNDFNVAKNRGLRLADIGECKAASAYLRAALAIRPDDTAVVDALKKCQ